MTVPPDRCTALGCEGEELVARVFGGRTTRPNHPVDVVTDTHAIEVKTVNADAGTLRTYMSRAALVRKNRYAKERGLEAMTVLVVAHSDRFEVYGGVGFRNYDLDFMHYLGTFER